MKTVQRVLEPKTIQQIQDRYSQGLSIFTPELIDWLRYLDNEEYKDEGIFLTEVFYGFLEKYLNIQSPQLLGTRMVLGFTYESQTQELDTDERNILFLNPLCKGIVKYSTGIYGSSWGYLVKADSLDYPSCISFIKIDTGDNFCLEFRISCNNANQDYPVKINWESGCDRWHQDWGEEWIERHRWENILVPFLEKWL